MIIRNNIMSMVAGNNYNKNIDRQKQTMEKLSSGYKVNRAADGAANLAISEKMRAQIKGLDRGLKNILDGMSFTNTAESALEVVTELLQRMRELSNISMNETLSDMDRSLINEEFEILKEEVNRITKSASFNTDNIFEEHEDSYKAVIGNKSWAKDQVHVITDKNNTIHINYKKNDDTATETLTVSVANGTYTTAELMLAIDDELYKARDLGVEINIEYTDDGCINFVYEGGEDIVSTAGGLTYLLFESYDSGTVGALLGTTEFRGGAPLLITDYNNHLECSLVDFFGTTTSVSLTVDNGYFTRDQIITKLNDKFDEQGLTNVRAMRYGDYCIQVYSEDYFVTGLRGNMFQLDDPAVVGGVYTSIFYDNIKPGTVTDTYGNFKGGAVLTTSSLLPDHNRFIIDSTNDTLVLRANGGNYVTITLDHGSISISEMLVTLRNKFDAAGLNLQVDTFTESAAGFTFYGFNITSLEKGAHSYIEFDKTASTAYSTLFETRSYAGTASVSSTLGRYSYHAGILTTTKVLTGPITITDSGNEFRIYANGWHTITLDTGTYNTVGELVAQINEKINGTNAPATLKGRVEITESGGILTFKGSDTKGLEAYQIRLQASGTDTGYNDLFTAETTTYSPNTTRGDGTASTRPSITLHFPATGTTIGASNNQFVVTVDGYARTVTLPNGTISDTAIINAINAQLTATEIDVDKSHSNTTTSGAYYHSSRSGSGSVTTDVSFTCNAVGTGKKLEGSTDESHLTPASYTIPVNLDATTVITDENKRITCKINGNTVFVDLDTGSYTRAQLAAEIQAKFDVAAPGFNGIDVTLNGNQLCFTTRLKGDTTSIQFSHTTGGSFITDITTTPNPATIILNNYTALALENSIAINSSNNEFKFTLNNTAVTVTLKNGSYDRNGFISMLNQCFTEQSVGATASLTSSNYLQLTTTKTGTGAQISLDTKTSGSSTTAIFGNLFTAATCTVSLAVQNNVTIDSTNRTFIFKIGSYETSVNLDTGTYTQAQLLTQLNSKLSGYGVTAELNASNQLVLKTTDATTYTSVTYTGGTSKSAIFGTDKKQISGVTATKDASGNLVLTGSTTGTGKYIYFSTEGGNANSLFLDRIPSTSYAAPSYTDGSFSYNQKAYIDGANLGSTITITELNKELNFTFGGGVSVSFELDEKTYTQAELRDALQTKIDAVIGAGNLNVTVSNSGVRIEAAVPADTIYNMTNFTGGFYRYIISGNAITTQTMATTYDPGQHIMNPAYAIGRQDVRSNPVEIIEGTNDELRMDFEINGQKYTIGVTLDAGTYIGDALATHIQGKLNVALVALGLNANTVKATIGGFNSGVVGSNDANALIFSLSGPDTLQAEGNYMIDNIHGSASFYIFYKTDGSPIPAFVQGYADLSKGVKITDENNTFSFIANNVTYEYVLDEGEYTGDEIVAHLNDKIQENPDPPIFASIVGGALRLSYTKFGNNEIHSVSGSAKSDLFYVEEGRIDADTEFNVKMSANKGDDMSIDRRRMSQVYLGLHTLILTTQDYAEKSLQRLKTALNKVSAAITYYGIIYNRLEYSGAVNNTAYENMQASESRLRDTDVAKEYMDYIKTTILKESASAMMAQANTIPEGVLKML